MDQKIGYDVGGVIMGGRGPASEGKDTAFFGAHWLETQETPGASETIKTLTGTRFPAHNSFIVSKCGAKTQAKTLRWLDHHRFYERTGLDPANVHFCRKRHEKAGICKELGITVFIDDRLEVLGHMIPIVPTLLLFRPDPEEVAQFSAYTLAVHQTDSWDDVHRLLLP